ncbi:MAG: hypothetical protein JO131_00345, partial [Gammaproteobacteria bacterium]|nr:hypothetical protein [Gammaproteobacteria bacterium]
ATSAPFVSGGNGYQGGNAVGIKGVSSTPSGVVITNVTGGSATGGSATGGTSFNQPGTAGTSGTGNNVAP